MATDKVVTLEYVGGPFDGETITMPDNWRGVQCEHEERVVVYWRLEHRRWGDYLRFDPGKSA